MAIVKAGDTVRYLNDVGGGTVTRVEGKIAYVDDGGFENPVLAKDLVVVLPAGHPAQQGGANLMFDQKAFDAGRDDSRAEEKTSAHKPQAALASLPKPQETDYGDSLNISLAFEPSDLKRLGDATFNAVLVNDSNYYLDFTFLRRGDGERGWTLVYRSTAAPNELIDLAAYKAEDLPQIERIALQCVAYKQGREFSLKAPLSLERRLDLTKFYKLHCFRPGLYFDTPVLELPLVKDDKPSGNADPALETLRKVAEKNLTDEAARKLGDKYNITAGRVKDKAKGRKQDPASNPNKLLPLIEVDLHIAELTDTTAGMQPSDMLAMQLDEVRRTMQAHRRRIGQKIVFIHGKGEGVLRKAVIALLKKEYPKAEIQDASFREYGFGATLVTIHQ